MIFNGKKTMYSSRLDNYKMLGRNYQPLINTTLNEKFVINPRYELEDGEYPVINVITIGTDFNEFNVDNNVLNLKSSPHSPMDAALFNHIPFYIRKSSELDNFPISDKYVLKKILIIDGVEHTAYYGYFVDGDDIVYKGDIVKYSGIETEYVNITKVDTNDGSRLVPIPVSNTQLDMMPDHFLGTFFKLCLFFTTTEVAELLNVFDVLYKDSTLRRITEVAVCSSVYKEELEDVVTCGVEYFVDTDYNIDDALLDKRLEFYIEVGNSEVIRG